jgi:outer membrane murein-binding lipoprotein Lpp
MTARTHPTKSTLDSRRAARMVGVAVALTALGLSGCGVVSAVKKVESDVRGNKATIDTFNSKLQTGAAVPFEATYVTTGSSPATIVYAVQPPKGLAFQETPSSGSGAVSIIVNSTGEYTCTPPSSGSGPSTCQQLSTANAAAENQIFDFYTPSHWITFLRDFSLAAGIAGDKVTSSTMTVNGFTMQCVDFQASGVAGTSTICSTSQGILGYVNVASDSTSFEIKSYSPTPTPSLFELPPGATVTTASTTP